MYRFVRISDMRGFTVCQISSSIICILIALKIQDHLLDFENCHITGYQNKVTIAFTKTKLGLGKIPGKLVDTFLVALHFILTFGN